MLPEGELEALAEPLSGPVSMWIALLDLARCRLTSAVVRSRVYLAALRVLSERQLRNAVREEISLSVNSLPNCR